MSDYGFRVSKTGYDVSSATPDQLAMTSRLTSDIVALYGAVSYTHTGTSSSASVVHNLGYAPQFRVYDFVGDNFVPVVFGDTTGGFISFDAYTTSTTLTIRITSNAAFTEPETYYYLIMYNPIQ